MILINIGSSRPRNFEMFNAAYPPSVHHCEVVKHVLKEESYAILESVKQHVDQQMDRFQRSQEDFFCS